MAYCSQCGSQLTQETRFCPNCGMAVASAEPRPESSPPDAPLPTSLSTETTSPLTAGQLPKDTRNMAMLCHLAAFAAFVGVPFGNIVGPLVVWLMKREESLFIDAHGKEALNFQISMTIYVVISAILILIVIGIFLLVGLLFFEITAIIKAAVRANNGQEHRYPLTIRFIK